MTTTSKAVRYGKPRRGPLLKMLNVAMVAACALGIGSAFAEDYVPWVFRIEDHPDDVTSEVPATFENGLDAVACAEGKVGDWFLDSVVMSWLRSYNSIDLNTMKPGLLLLIR